MKITADNGKQNKMKLENRGLSGITYIYLPVTLNSENHETREFEKK